MLLSPIVKAEDEHVYDVLIHVSRDRSYGADLGFTKSNATDTGLKDSQFAEHALLELKKTIPNSAIMRPFLKGKFLIYIDTMGTCVYVKADPIHAHVRQEYQQDLLYDKPKCRDKGDAKKKRKNIKSLLGKAAKSILKSLKGGEVPLSFLETVFFVNSEGNHAYPVFHQLIDAVFNDYYRISVWNYSSKESNDVYIKRNAARMKKVEELGIFFQKPMIMYSGHPKDVVDTFLYNEQTSRYFAKEISVYLERFKDYPQFDTEHVLEHALEIGAAQSTIAVMLKHFPDFDNIRTKKGKSLLGAALARQSLDTARLLIDNGADINVTDREGLAPVHTAGMLAGHLENKGFEALDMLLNAGADINMVSTAGHTALSQAIAHNMQRETPENGDFLVTQFISRGATPDPDIEPHALNAATPLYMAVHFGDIDAALALLDYGANPNFGPQGHSNPLNLAIFKGQAELVAAMLAYGADVNKPDGKGVTPLVSAINAGNAAAAYQLLEFGADINGHKDAALPPVIAAYQAYMGEITTELLERGADLSYTDDSGKTLLHYAAARGDGATVEQLISAGMDVNTLDQDENTALYYAYPHPSFEFSVERRRLISTLKEAGTDAEHSNLFGYTAADNYRVGKETYERELQLQQMEELTLRQEMAAHQQQMAAEALRQERERRQQAIMAERQRRAEAAKRKTGFNWGKAIAMGAGAILGGAMEMDEEAQGQILAGIIRDSGPGVQGMSGLQSAVNGVVAQHQAANGYSSGAFGGISQIADQTPITLEDNYFQIAGRNDLLSCNVSDGQLRSMCQAANVYYNRYLELANARDPNAAAIYNQHKLQARQAMRFQQNYKTSAGFDLSGASARRQPKKVPVRQQVNSGNACGVADAPKGGREGGSAVCVD